MNKSSNNYDLEERTAKFGEKIILLCRSLQLIRSATSIGANYMEANGASSRKDFKNKIFICKKEAQETKHWLRMLASCFADKKPELTTHWKECQELTLIFQKIGNSLNKN